VLPDQVIALLDDICKWGNDRMMINRGKVTNLKKPLLRHFAHHEYQMKSLEIGFGHA
jgi:hypothetical protein